MLGVDFFKAAAALCVGLSIVCAFMALNDALSNNDKRNVFLLSSVLALWSIVAMLAAILVTVS